MDLQFTWLLVFFRLTVRVNSDPHLSKHDLGLLHTKPYPVCFTRHLHDFTCFWKTPVGKSFEFVYKKDEYAENICNITQQETAENETLHVCVFPTSDVYLFGPTHIRVVDQDLNTTVYDEILYVEDNCLLYPPVNVSLTLTGKPGEILVKWPAPREFTNFVQYELRYTSEASQHTVKLKKGSKCQHTLLSLVPGQPCSVQIRVKASFSDTAGHWSDWSHTVTALVPQTAADIELKCHTSDLHRVCCQWNEERYGYASFYYRRTDRNIWGDWRTCGGNNVSASHCVLYGDESSMFQVYLTTSFGLLNRTFYMDVFWMNNSIKTEPPDGLKDEIIGERLCLSWRSPLLQISEHLMYQIRYKLQEESKWKHFTVQNHSASTCLDVQASGGYIIQLRAIPNGLFYRGHWSDWSKPFTKQLTSKTGLLFIICVPFGLLIISVALYFSFSKYVSKLKLILWPPLPNLNNVLENFLKDIDGQSWELNIGVKQCDDDIPPSLVEIMSEKEARLLRTPSWTSNFLAVDSNEESGLEMSREYVTLKSSPVQDVSILNGNDYVYGLNIASSYQLDESICCYSSFCPDTFSASSTNILNHSYLQAEIGSLCTLTGHYTNFKKVAMAKKE